MAIGDVPLTPIIDTVTGSVTEIGRIFLRTLTAAVGALAPIDAAYWTSRAAGVLSAEVNLGALASGYLKIATAVGIATPTTVPTIPQADVTGLTAALAGKATLPIAEADVTGLVADLASKAPLVSPALTGVPTAPTAAASTNTTQIASTAMVQGAVAPLAKLAGGNTFTGPQTITGNATVSGTVCVNTTVPLVAAKVTVVGDAATSNGVAVQNANAGIPGIGFLSCVNSGGAVQGQIVGVTTTSVAYNTTSDARLKTDAGRAADLSALRALVVHDFMWKADGVRDRGVFAQEAHALYPRAVTPGTDDTTADGSLARPWGTDYSKFVADLIVGWQQHEAAIAELRAALSGAR